VWPGGVVPDSVTTGCVHVRISTPHPADKHEPEIFPVFPDFELPTSCNLTSLTLTMSGFEIAGLILGAFPILISALKGYGELARKVGLWNSIRQEYQKSKNEINAQHVQFIGNLRRLLLTVGVDDARISRLLADPRGGEWEAEDLARWFQDHLQDSHDVLLETINEMGRAMEELKKEIIVDAENIRQKIEQTKVPI
jgi:hypothetical protein